MRLFFLIVFIGLSSYSQKISLGDFTGYKNSSLDTLNNTFELYFVDHMLSIDLDNYEKTYTALSYGNRISQKEGTLGSIPIRVQDSLYFINGAGGMVFMVRNDTVKRIDKSFDHHMQYGACWFAHNHTVFSYGGYGFWSNRDFFTFYDNKQDEWEVYHPINSKKIPRGTMGSHFIKEANEFHFFDGYLIDPNNRREKILNNEVWTFNFNTNKWRYLGQHETLDEFIKKISYKHYLLLIELNQITRIDIKNNKKTTYLHSPVSAQQTAFTSMHYAHGKFYIVIGNITGVYLNIVEEDDFFGAVKSQTKFYKNRAHWVKLITIYGLSLFLLMFIVWLIKKNFSKLNKIQLLDNGLRFRNKFVEFDIESRSILKLLLAEEEVPSANILSLVEKEQYSPAHNERIKVQKIKDINLKISTLRGISENVISSFKSSSDKRVRIYKVSKKYFRK
jgi:hypothetical protein